MAKTQAPFSLVPAADGHKMSKRLKNYPDPAHILDTYGADALRLYVINSTIVRAELLKNPLARTRLFWQPTSEHQPGDPKPCPLSIPAS